MENVVAYYHSEDRKVDRKNRVFPVFSPDPKIVRVAILGSSTLKGVKEALNVKCSQAGLVMKSYVGEYAQYNQEILDKGSGLYEFKPHLTIMMIDIIDLLGENYYFPYRLSERGRRSLVEAKRKELLSLAKAFARDCDGVLLINNFSVPTYSPMGILEPKQKFGFFEMIRALNRALEEASRKNPQLHIFDYDAFLSKSGKMECSDDKMRYIADMKISQSYVPALCDEYMRYVKAIKAKMRKCIVLDLDNTLWGGIVGEDDFASLRLGPTAPGNAFVEFQKYILNLFERGIILAINSNNNEKDSLAVIRKHPHMILREKHFAAIRINWENKVRNLMDIAKEINIGLDSIIYIDDDKANRQLVREMAPEVLTLEMPPDAALYVRTIRECKDLDTLHITEEDMKRGAMYAEEKKRKDSFKSFGDIGDFLAHLNIEVRIERSGPFSIPRISQLTQRTNQFNFTTRRLSDTDIRSLAGDKTIEIYSISVKDRFGDSGISGMLSFKVSKDAIMVEDLLLSCRVLGKGVEESVLAFLAETARKSDLSHIICRYIPTAKNSMVQKFLKSSGFARVKTPGNGETWRFMVKRGFKRPGHIKVVVK